MYHIQEAAQISGISVRTLHYYDEIGLLSPQKLENGYRLYSNENMDTLQHILFYKFLGFPLKEIKKLLNQENMTKITILENQLLLLEQKEIHLQELIETLQKTIQSMKGEFNMSVNEKFKGFCLEDQQAYRDEAIETYGEATILSAEEKQRGKETEMLQVMNSIFFAFSENLKNNLPISDNANIQLAEKLHEALFTYSFDCTLGIFEKIGKGYIADERFKDNIDKFGAGTAQYVSDAIAEYVTLTKSR